MDASLNGYIEQANRITQWVWYQGTDALLEGEAVCYDTATGTAADTTGKRVNQVIRPTAATNKAFAGVAARDYTASSTAQLIEINCPGSMGVNIALGVDTTIGTGLLSFVAGAAGSHRGRFYTGKYRGRGSAIPRQTVTAVLEASMTGGWSLATDGVTLTVSDTTGISAGDTVVLVGGEIEDGGATVTPGKYTVSSVTDGTDLVLTASALADTALAACTCTGFAYTGNPKCQADLLTGDESGGVEFISPPNAGVVGITYMTGGVTYVCGGVTLAADVDVTFAQGTLPGETKAFLLLGDLATSDFTLDLETNGIRLDGSTALTEILTIDDTGDGAYLMFQGVRWFTQDLAVGATEG